ncbi:MAG: ATP-binding protein [Coprothermobacterota bacterium]|nr:ATP-binding protein [Coprothermobacterota bacterium]
MYWRNIHHKLEEALGDTPAVFLAGARQSGKTTLVRRLAEQWPTPTIYLNFDDPSVLVSAQADPLAFLRRPSGLLVLDEVQRIPSLFSVIKLLVDDNRVPGRFLLTGSANVLLVPHVSESLVGRMEILTLWPLSQGELEGRREGFLEDAFQSEELAFPVGQAGLEPFHLRGLLAGGFPEAVRRTSLPRRRAWFQSYLTTLLDRDVRDLARVEGLSQFPRLLALLAQRTGSPLNVAELGRLVGLPYATLTRYLTLLEATYLVQSLPSWSTNAGKRQTKAAKLYLVDCGLLAFLLGIGSQQVAAHSPLLGPLLETLAVNELSKQASWCPFQVHLSHFHTHQGREVDLVLEDGEGRVVGVEVKASTTIQGKDMRGLQTLAEEAGPRFLRGFLLYLGERCLPFGPNLWALPFQSLWRWGNRPQEPAAATI